MVQPPDAKVAKEAKGTKNYLRNIDLITRWMPSFSSITLKFNNRPNGSFTNVM
jgi:hypothetical protein